MTEIPSKEEIRRMLEAIKFSEVARIITEAPEVIPNIIELMVVDTSANVRFSASLALSRASDNERCLGAVISGVIEALEHDDSDARKRATNFLSHRAEDRQHGTAAVTALIAVLSHTNPNVRAGAAEALGDAAGKMRDRLDDLSTTIRSLIDLLRDTDENVRWNAACSLHFAAKASDIDMSLVGRSLAEYVWRVRETGSPEDAISAEREAAKLYVKVVSAASKRAEYSAEMEGEILDTKPMPPRGQAGGMFRQPINKPMGLVINGCRLAAQ